MFLWQFKAYVVKKTYQLTGGLLDRQVANTLWWRSLRVHSTPEPDGETEAAFGGWHLRVATETPWHHMQRKEPSQSSHCM